MEVIYVRVTAVLVLGIPYGLHQVERLEIAALCVLVSSKIQVHLHVTLFIIMYNMFVFLYLAAGFKQSSLTISGVNTSHAITVVSTTFDEQLDYDISFQLQVTALDRNRRKCNTPWFAYSICFKFFFYFSFGSNFEHAKV